MAPFLGKPQPERGLLRASFLVHMLVWPQLACRRECCACMVPTWVKYTGGRDLDADGSLSLGLTRGLVLSFRQSSGEASGEEPPCVTNGAVCLAFAEAHPCLWRGSGGGGGCHCHGGSRTAKHLPQDGLARTLCRQNVGPGEHGWQSQPSPGCGHVARWTCSGGQNCRVSSEQDGPVRKTRSGLGAGGARHSTDIAETVGGGAARSGPGPGAVPRGRCPPLRTWEPADAPTPAPFPALPFSGPRFLAVTPLPFCALWFCKSRNPGTETSPQAAREAGQPGNNGLAPALPRRPQTTFPARQFSVHFLRRKRNLGHSRRGGGLSRAEQACAPLSTRFHLEICHVLPKWQDRQSQLPGPATCRSPSADGVRVSGDPSGPPIQAGSPNRPVLSPHLPTRTSGPFLAGAPHCLPGPLCPPSFSTRFRALSGSVHCQRRLACSALPAPTPWVPLCLCWPCL